MKTTVKQLVAGTFFALLLLVLNVKAEGTESKSSSHESIETKLQVENWMTDESLWKTNTMFIVEFIQETESSMKLENWMTEEKVWNLNNDLVEEVDGEIGIESGMMNDEIWETNSIYDELEVEDWMINSKVWN